MIKFLQKTGISFRKNANFFAECFGETILNITTSGPGTQIPRIDFIRKLPLDALAGFQSHDTYGKKVIFGELCMYVK
jgi:hypothetical protein